MGMYDTFVKGNIAVQIKAGPCEMAVYKEGDDCILPDATYCAFEGYVAIKGGKVLLITTNVSDIVKLGLPLYDKWGAGPYKGPPDTKTLLENSPVVAAMNEVQNKKPKRTKKSSKK